VRSGGQEGILTSMQMMLEEDADRSTLSAATAALSCPTTSCGADAAGSTRVPAGPSCPAAPPAANAGPSCPAAPPAAAASRTSGQAGTADGVPLVAALGSGG
jgi:hypothetical protein